MDGRQNNCKSCRKFYAVQAAPQIKMQMAQYYQEHCEVLDERTQDWRAANPDEARKHSAKATKKLYWKNPEVARAKAVAWGRANPDRRWLAHQRKHAKDWGVTEFTATYQDWLDAQAATGGRCYYCGAGGKMHTEHKTPLARKGQHVKENIVPACLRCNVAKHQLTEAEYREVLAQDQRA